MSNVFVHGSNDKSTSLIKEFFSTLIPSKYDFSKEKTAYLDDIIRESLESGFSYKTSVDRIIESSFKSGFSTLTQEELIDELHESIKQYYDLK